MISQKTCKPVVQSTFGWQYVRQSISRETARSLEIRRGKVEITQPEVGHIFNQHFMQHNTMMVGTYAPRLEVPVHRENPRII